MQQPQTDPAVAALIGKAADVGRVLTNAPDVCAMLARDLDGPAAERVERAARHLVVAREEICPSFAL